MRCRNITSEQRVFDSKETYCVQIKMLILSVTLKNPGQFLDDELEFCLHFHYRGAAGMARCDF